MFSPKDSPRHVAGAASGLPFLLLVCAALVGARAWAIEEVWVGGSGVWSADANWLDGTPPDPTAGPTLTLRFSDSLSTAYTATNDLGGAFELNAIALNTSNGGAITVGNRYLRFLGSAPKVEATGVGVSTLLAFQGAYEGQGSLIMASEGLTFSQTGAAEMIINTPLSESGGSRSVTIAGQPSSVDAGLITLSEAQNFTGPLVLQSGNLALPARTSAGSLVVKGGTLRFVSFGGSLPFARTISLHNDLVVVGTDLSSSINLTGAISSATAGTGLTLRGNSSLSMLALSAASTYTGATRIGFGPLSTSSSSTGGTIRLTGNGSLLNSSLFDIRDGGVLQVEIPTAAAPNRIRDGAPVELRTGELLFGGGNGLSPQLETVGPLHVGGYSTVTVATGTSASTRLTSASLARLDRGTALFRGANLGGAFANNTANVLFTSAPAGLVGGNGAGPEISILPYAIGDIARTGTGSGFVTYDASTGVRVLGASEYANGLPAGASTQNVKLSAPVTHEGNATMNSLLLAGGSVSGSGTLAITSGAVLTTRAATIENALEFGGTDGKLFTPFELAVSGAIAGSGGLTKSGNATLTLSAASNPFTGGLTVNAGRIAFDSVAQLGSESSAIVLDGHTAGLTYTGAGTLSLSRDIAALTGVAAFHASGSGIFELSGTISGDGGLRLSSTTGAVRVTGTNSFAGPVFVRPGFVEISSDAALGNGELILGGGNLRLLAPLSTSRTTRIDPGGTIDTAGFDATWSGLLLGAGTFSKHGAGTLTLSGASPFSGRVIVSRGGMLRLAEEGLLRSGNLSVESGSRLLLDNAGAARTSRIADSATVTLAGGEIKIAGSASGNITETIGSLVIGSGIGENAVTLQSPGNFGTTLRAGTLAVNAGSFLVRGVALGGPSGGAFTRLQVATPPALDGGFVRDAFAEDLAGGGLQFAVYDQTSDAAGLVGLRPLRASEQTAGTVIANPANGGTTPVDANFAATGATSASGAVNRINSLSLANGGSLTLGAAQTVAIHAGAVLVRAGAAETTISGGTLDFGANPARLATFGDLFISSALTGSGGLRKTGGGILTLQTAPAYDGITTIAGGILRVGSPEVLSGETLWLNSGGVFDLNNAAASAGALAGDGEVRLGTGTLTLGTLGTDLSFGGILSGTGTLQIVSGGNPSAVREFTGSPLFAGSVMLDSGQLAFKGARPLGTAALTINGGQLFTSTASSSANAITLNTDFVVRGGGELTIAAPGSLAGAHDVLVGGRGGLAFEAPAAHTGETRTTFGEASPVSFAAGPITLRGATGALTATSAIRIAPSSALVIDDSTPFSGSASGRVPDAAPVFLSSSELRLTGASGVATIESIGALSASGFSTVSVAPAAASTARLVASRLERMNRAGVLVRGSALGSVLAPGVAQVSFNAAPSGLVGGGGTGPNTNILPFIVGDSSATGSGTGFVTYDPATGLRLLNPATEYTMSLAAAAPTHNVSLAGNETNDAAVTVNSIVLDGNETLSGTGTISVTSGAVLRAPGTSGAARIVNNLQFGAAEGHIHSMSGGASLIVDGVISGSGGLTKSGANALALNGANDFTGPLTINSGDIIFSSMANLGADTSPVVFNANVNGAALSYVNPSRGSLTFTRDIIANSGYAVLRTSNSLSDFYVPSTISGAGGLGITGSPSYVVLSGTNSYTGPTVVQGNLAISSDAALGNGGALELKSGTLRLDGPWTTSRPIIASGNAPVITNGHDVVWTGPLTSAGGNLSVSGSGLLTIPTRSDYNGVLGATNLRLTDQGALPAVTRINSSMLQLDNTAIALSDRVGDTAVVSAGIEVLGNAASPVREVVGSVTSGLISLTAPGSASTILEAENLRPFGNTLIRGDALGGGPAGAFTRLIFQTAPATTGGLLPNTLVSASATGTGESFALYDTTVDAAGPVGVRPLRFGDYYSASPVQNPANGGTTPTDAQLLINGSMNAIGAANAVNSVTASDGGTLALAAGQRLTIGNGSILAPTGTAASITGGELAIAVQRLDLLGNGDLTIGSRLPGLVSKNGSGTTTLLYPTLPALSIGGGLLRISNTLPVDVPSAFVGNGTSLEITAPSARLRRIEGSGTLRFADELIVGNESMFSSSPSVFDGPVFGTGDLVQIGNISARFTKPLSYPGATRALRDASVPRFGPGTLAFSDAATLFNTSGLEASGGSTIHLINYSADSFYDQPPLSPRIPTVPVTLHSGTLRVSGTTLGPVRESAGPLSGSGVSTVALGLRPGQPVQLDFTSLARSDRGTFVFEGVTGGAPGPGAATLTFGPGPTALLVGSGTSATSTPILPFAVEMRTNRTATEVPNFVTYDAAQGVRPLGVAEYASALTAGANVRLTNVSVVNDAPITVNSLALDGANLSGTGTISVASGALLSNRSYDSISNNLDFGAAEGSFFLTAGLTLNGALSGSGGLTFSGLGTTSLPAVTLSGANNVTGPLTINATLLNFSSISALGPESSEILLHDGGLYHRGTAEAVLTRSIRLEGYQATLGDTTSFPGSLRVSGIISGPGSLRLQGDLSLEAENSYTGFTDIGGGRIMIASEKALGVNPLVRFSGGVLAFPASGDFSKNVHVQGGYAQFDTGPHAIHATGSISSSNSSDQLIKSGVGTLVVRDATRFTGTVFVNEGTLELEGAIGGTRLMRVESPGVLTGSGTVPELDARGSIAPGAGIGTLRSGTATFADGATLAIELGSAGSYDQLDVTGTISLNGTVGLTLALLGGYDPAPGDAFTIVRNDGNDPVAFGLAPGRFSYAGNLLDPEETFFAGNEELRISYAGGDGNDVVLISVPEPGAALGLLAGFMMVLSARRRRPRKSGL